MFKGGNKTLAKQWFFLLCSPYVCLKFSIIKVKPQQIKISSENALQVVVNKLSKIIFLNLQLKIYKIYNYLQTSVL